MSLAASPPAHTVDDAGAAVGAREGVTLGASPPLVTGGFSFHFGAGGASSAAAALLSGSGSLSEVVGSLGLTSLADEASKGLGKLSSRLSAGTRDLKSFSQGLVADLSSLVGVGGGDAGAAGAGAGAGVGGGQPIGGPPIGGGAMPPGGWYAGRDA